jgi:hypothetical protein
MDYDHEIDNYWWCVQDLAEHMHHKGVSEVLRDALTVYDRVRAREENKAVREASKALTEHSPF